LPVATKSTVGIFASGQALESLIMHLLSDQLTEAKLVGKQLLEQCRQVIPAFLERADKPERGGAMVAYSANTRASVANICSRFSLAETIEQDVTLVDYWPKNELDILADIAYEHSTLSKTELRAQLAVWPYSQKTDLLRSYIGERLNRRHKPGRAFEQPHYSFDLICDYGIFRDLQRHRMVDDLNWQKLSPNLGFEQPKLIQDSGLTKIFEKAIALSETLYDILTKKGYTLEAQYATLFGHKMRWKITYNARAAYHLHELRTTPHGHPGYRKLVAKMHDKVAEVHPIIAAGMQFVSKDEDPELTRLAAERATQYKLKNL
jgi:thymidylate synthase ThyX